MDELELQSETLQPHWYNADELESISESSQRWRNGVRSPIWRPATDVYETTDSIIVRVEIAGMREEDFSISLAGNQLSIRGNRPDIQERRAYHQMEIFFGEFQTEVDLPGPVVSDQVNAEYVAGFLRLVFPKEQPTKVSITE
jgi:HSP20 family protein